MMSVFLTKTVSQIATESNVDLVKVSAIIGSLTEHQIVLAAAFRVVNQIILIVSAPDVPEIIKETVVNPDVDDGCRKDLIEKVSEQTGIPLDQVTAVIDCMTYRSNVEKTLVLESSSPAPDISALKNYPTIGADPLIFNVRIESA